MNLLELAQEIRRLSGTGGTGPTAVAGATGIELRIINYAINAWIDIQTHPKKWKWMWGNYLAPAPGGAPLQTILNTRIYPLTGVESVRVKSFKSYLTATGTTDRQRMTWMDWQGFEQSTGVVTETAKRPIRVTRDPAGNLHVFPKADAAYSVEFEYFKTAVILAADGDTPDMKEDFHMLIVYEALKRFGKAEDAPEVIKLGEEAAGSDGNEGRPTSGLWRSLIWSQEFKDADTDDENPYMVVRTRMDGDGDY